MTWIFLNVINNQGKNRLVKKADVIIGYRGKEYSIQE